MVTGLIATKIQPWGERHMLGCKEMTAEREGNTEAQLAQGWQQEITTATELGATLFQNAQGLRGKTGQRGVLRHAGSADVEVLRQLLQFTDRIGRRHQPTQAPAGHAEILRKTI